MEEIKIEDFSIEDIKAQLALLYDLSNGNQNVDIYALFETFSEEQTNAILKGLQLQYRKEYLILKCKEARINLSDETAEFLIKESEKLKEYQGYKQPKNN